MTERQVKQTNIRQGEDEAITYTLDVTNVGSSPGTPSAKIFSFNESAGTYTDVTGTNMSGAAGVSGNVITLPQISGLTDGVRYRVEVQYVISGDTFESYFWILGER